MKRRISLVIAFALSFLMMFGSIARADEIKGPISVSTSEPAKLEIIIKVPLTETKKADSPPSQAKTSEQAWKGGKQTGEQEECNRPRCGECETSSDDRGMWKTGEDGATICVGCIEIKCDQCNIGEGGGYLMRRRDGSTYCHGCHN